MTTPDWLCSGQLLEELLPSSALPLPLGAPWVATSSLHHSAALLRDISVVLAANTANWVHSVQVFHISHTFPSCGRSLGAVHGLEVISDCKSAV